MPADPSPGVVPIHPPPGLLERDALITPPELAAFLGLPVRTLGQWRYIGVGPVWVNVGRHVRYEPADVRAWLDSQRGELAEDRPA